MQTVTVGCKLPNGLHMDLRGDGGELVKRITLNGANNSEVIGGYGITHNIDKDAFEEWKLRNADFPPLKKGLIFAYDKPATVASQAKEQAELKSGFEGMDPEKPAPGVERAKDDR